MLLKRVLKLLLFMLLPTLIWAQETTSEIAGIVLDGKSPIEGVAILAIHQPTGTKYSTTTRKDGRFNLSGLRVGGPYSISTDMSGFKSERQENVSLSLGQTYEADFNLKTSASDLGSVVVTSVRQGKIFNNWHTGAQEIITRDQMDKLPTINRSLQDFTKLEPTSNGLSFGGRSSQYNNITVDGANFNNSFGLSGVLGGQTSSQPISLEAIDQIQVNVSPYDVRQGGFSGAGVNTITKSGTNKFSGSVYTYLKGAGTQGYNVSNASVARTPLKYYIRGVSLGGPIIKDKLFFFGSYETVHQEVPATSIVASTASNPAVTGAVSTANADSLNKLADFLKSKYKFDPGQYQGYNFLTKSDKVTFKIDWNINSTNTLSIKWNYLKSYADQFASTSRPGSGLVAGGNPNSTSGSGNVAALPFFSAGYGINNNFNIFIAELNSRFSSSITNKLQVGYTALRDFRAAHSPSSTMPFVDILNSNKQIMTSFGNEMYTYNNVLNTNVFQFSDIAILYKGAHEITLGTQDYYRKYQNAFAPGYQGVYQFSSVADFINSANSGKAPFAANYYLQYSALANGDFPWAYAGSTELGFFAQDKWRMTKNFTLTYGLRYDMTIYKQAFTDNPNFDNLKFKDGESYNIGKAPKNAIILSPRVGFNWDIKGDKTLQLRGGVGIFSGPPPFVWISNQASNNGIQFGSFTNKTTAFNSDPNAYRPAAGAANTRYNTAMVANNFKYPTVMKSSLAVDKRLGDWIFTIEGSYSKDINAVYYSNVNLNEENGFALTGADNRMRYLPSGTFTGNAYTNVGNKYYSKGTDLSHPNLDNAILMKNTNKGYSYYVTGRIQKTFGSLYTSVAYTYSKTKAAAQFGSTASSLWSGRPVGNADPNAANLGYADVYQPHRVIASASYKVLYAQHFSTSVGAIFEATSAGTTSYVYNGDLNGDGNNANDLIYIPKDKSEITLVKASGTSDSRTADQLWNQLNNFINQDKYLSFNKGKYAQANGVLLPFYKRLDLNITQDIYFFSNKNDASGGDRHTLRLTVDLINAGNFFNRNWGIVKQAATTNFLKFEGMAADGKTPTFSMPYQDATNQIPYTNSFVNNTSILSRWQMQFGIKYIFN